MIKKAKLKELGSNWTEIAVNILKIRDSNEYVIIEDAKIFSILPAGYDLDKQDLDVPKLEYKVVQDIALIFLDYISKLNIDEIDIDSKL